MGLIQTRIKKKQSLALKNGNSQINSSSTNCDFNLDDDFRSVYLQCKYCHVSINKLGIVIKQDEAQTVKFGKMIIDNKECSNAQTIEDTVHAFYPPDWS